MKLLYRITLRISLALLLLFAVWGTVFYFLMIDEINDETDDTLEDYSEYIIKRIRSGENLPESDNGTSNSYYITEVDAAYAQEHTSAWFLEREVFIYSKHDTEQARIMKQVFEDRDGRYYELTVMVPSIEKEDLQETILLWIVILYVGLLLAILIVNAVVLRRSLRPLYALLAWLDRFTLDRELPPLNLETEIEEFKKLADSLVKSARRNVEIYEQQRMFIGHASHELQTPIAVAINRLELLADDPQLTEFQLERILKARKSLEDAAKLNKTLLLLSKIENRQFTQSERIEINEMLRNLIEDFTEVYHFQEIVFSLIERTTLRVEMNRMLLSVLLGNLLKNAFIHNRRGGEIRVEIDGNRVILSNTSDSEELDPSYIFRRFYQKSQREGSTGLGLSLVDSIAKMYGIGVEYRYEYGRHVFRIVFPDSMLLLK